MKWIKHETDSLDSEFIQSLLREYGANGYLAYYGILEIAGKAVGYNPDQKVNFSPTFLKQKLHISPGKLKEIFEFCSGKGELFFNFSQENFEFHIPKLLKLKDNYVKDLQVACKKPSNHKEVEVEVEVKKKIKINPIAAFDIFYKAYPKHKGKEAAKKAWEKIKPDDNLLQVILKSLESFKKSKQWQKDKGEFIPHPATWLNNKRWEDEPDLQPQAQDPNKPFVFPPNEYYGGAPKCMPWETPR